MMGENRKKGFWLDPRANLFLILMCVLASMVAPSLGDQFILVLLIALSRWRSCCATFQLFRRIGALSKTLCVCGMFPQRQPGFLKIRE